MSPMNRRRLAAFRASKRGMVCLVVFGVLFFWQVPHFHAIALYRQRVDQRIAHARQLLKGLPG